MAYRRMAAIDKRCPVCGKRLKYNKDRQSYICTTSAGDRKEGCGYIWSSNPKSLFHIR